MTKVLKQIGAVNLSKHHTENYKIVKAPSIKTLLTHNITPAVYQYRAKENVEHMLNFMVIDHDKDKATLDNLTAKLDAKGISYIGWASPSRKSTLEEGLYKTRIVIPTKGLTKENYPYQFLQLLSELGGLADTDESAKSVERFFFPPCMVGIAQFEKKKPTDQDYDYGMASVFSNHAEVYHAKVSFTAEEKTTLTHLIPKAKPSKGAVTKGEWVYEAVSGDKVLTRKGESIGTFDELRAKGMLKGREHHFDCPFDASVHSTDDTSTYGWMGDDGRLHCDGTHLSFLGVLPEDMPREEMTVKKVTKQIKKLKDFTSAGLEPILRLIIDVPSELDRETLLNTVKDRAMKRKTKLSIKALRDAFNAVLNKVAEEYEEKHPTEEIDLNKMFEHMKPVVVGSSLYMQEWKECISVINGVEAEHTELSLVKPLEMGRDILRGVEQDAFMVWNESATRPTYDGLTFNPSAGAIIHNRINLYTGFSVEPKAGDVTPFLTFLKEVICNGDEASFHYMKGYLGHQFQQPTDKSGVAIVLMGNKGTGKDTIIDMIGKLYDSAYMVIGNSEQLVGRFNGHLANVMMLNSPEATYAGSHKTDEVLKNLITGTTLTIEKKGIDAFTRPNYMRVYMSTNNDWAVKASSDERRYMILGVNDKRKQDIKYFKGLWDWYNKGGKEALLNWVLNIDISGFDVREDIPETEAMKEQKALSLEPFELAVGKLLSDSVVSELSLMSKDIGDTINSHPQLKQHPLSDKAIDMKLAKMFGKSWKLKDVRTRTLKLDEAMTMFCVKVGIENYFDGVEKPTNDSLDY